MKTNINKKGKLKIFFGYAAGVGKTYAMLQRAHELKKQNVDVVIGYYEPHRRPDTEKLIKGLERIPTKKIKYKNINFEEFDINKALKRKPSIILIDELAHTNVEGSRNAKRYLDILELLDAGIDVYTTVNVQHLESINDLIKEKTDSNVRETIPDNIFNKCDEVELIDIDPKELIERLKKGKIYPKKQIELALNNFFTLKKLNSLREMSMRQSADKINMNEGGNSSSEVMVLITPSPSSEKNIRAAARLAEIKHCTFSALYVEKDKGTVDSKVLENHISLVENLGGSTTILYGDDIPNIIANYVKIHQIKIIVIGKSWSRSLKKGIENQLISLLPDVEFSIIPYTKKSRASWVKKKNLNITSFDWISTIKTITLIALLIPIYFFATNDFNVLSIFLFFLSMLIISYKNKNVLYIFFVSLGGALGYILLGQHFDEQKYRILVQILTFFIMFFMGLFYGWFVYKYSNQIKKINRSNKSIDAINVLVSNIQKCNNEEEKYKAIGETLSALFLRSCYIYVGMNSKNNQLIVFENDKDSFDNENDKATMEWTKKNNRPSGKGTQTLASMNARYEPIAKNNGEVIVIGLSCKDGKLNYQDLLLLKTLLPIVQISIN